MPRATNHQKNRSIGQIAILSLLSLGLLFAFVACENGLPQKEGSTQQETATQTEIQPTEEQAKESTVEMAQQRELV